MTSATMPAATKAPPGSQVADVFVIFGLSLIHI